MRIVYKDIKKQVDAAISEAQRKSECVDYIMLSFGEYRAFMKQVDPAALTHPANLLSTEVTYRGLLIVREDSQAVKS